MKSTNRKPLNFFMFSDFYLRSLLYSLTRVTSLAKLKSFNILLIIGLGALGCEISQKKLWAGNLFIWSDLTFDISFKVN